MMNQSTQPPQADLARAKAEARAIVREWRNTAEWAARATIDAIHIGALSPVTLLRLRKALDAAPASLFAPKGQDDDHK